MLAKAATEAVDTYNQMLSGIYRARNQNLVTLELFDELMKLAKIKINEDPKPSHYEIATTRTMTFIRDNLPNVAACIDQVMEEKASAASQARR